MAKIGPKEKQLRELREKRAKSEKRKVAATNAPSKVKVRGVGRLVQVRASKR
jgi:hypothetical protein